ncbi:MAG: CBS domain-containing protein [Nitrospirota bacterium]
MKEVMSAEVAPVDASTPVREAVNVLRNLGFYIVIVCRHNEPVSALTEYDIVINGTASDDYSGSVTLHDHIKTHVAIRCREDAILADAIPAMIDHHVRHVPVVDEKGTLVGALSLMNALGAVAPDAAAMWLTKMQQSTAKAPSFE